MRWDADVDADAAAEDKFAAKVVAMIAMTNNKEGTGADVEVP